MTKSELIEHIASQAEISKAAADRALSATLDGIRRGIKNGGTVTLVGFGTFSAPRRAARTGRNPSTGEAVAIPAARVPKFKPGKPLRDALN